MLQEKEPTDPAVQEFWNGAQGAVDAYRAGDMWAIQRHWPTVWTAARGGVLSGAAFWAIYELLASV